ncbi:MAG: DNA methylase [Lachnospiraceae bacterium]|nr:DNA methylase [Lachnospiraceae bacterium]
MFIAIDLKSFYASVECVERGLDPLTTKLVVADSERTSKTICLAVSPALKAYGISGRARLFEVEERVKLLNAGIKKEEDKITYITAKPRMKLYMDYSTKIYNIYLKYVAPEDMHIYSVDEVFIDASAYLNTYKMTAHELAITMIRDVLNETGITATAGIGTNLYLCKIAMDIVAKHMPADSDGVRIAELDERKYRELLWDHKPITDFWRVGRGYQKRLAEVGITTMGEVARCSIGKENEHYNEDLLYKRFGVNAELLIDHAWGWEPVTMAEIKAYRPSTNSISSGQVLTEPYPYDKARLIVKEMTELLVLDLVDKGVVTDQMVLTIGYDVENLTNPDIKKKYHGPVTIDHYGRPVPKHAHGTFTMKKMTSSTKLIREAVLDIFDRTVNPNLTIRRVTIAACRLKLESEMEEDSYEQLDLFTDYEAVLEERKSEEETLGKEKKLQHAMLDIQKRYGKNAILKGMNLEDGAMTIKRNGQIGGHKA